MEKTRTELIEAFKKANKQRRQKIVEKNGFKTPEEYMTSLLTLNKPPQTPKKAKVSKMKGTFYVIDILDATGSMSGGKYNNSKEGIVAGIKDLSPRKDVKYSLIEFIELRKALNKPLTDVIPSDVKTSGILFYGAHGGDTPLYKTVYEVIKGINVSKDDKVLVNVYTDGGNNTAYEYTEMAAKLLNDVQKDNFTVTFVATPEDLARIKRDINIDDSNTLATANTAEGFKMSMGQTRSARTMYFASAEAGTDVLKGFYKKEGVL
jgi:hypothetical protein